MKKKLILSSVSLLSVIALGVGATFALLTTDPVTISTSSITTGDANIKICNAQGSHTWSTSISPAMTITGVIPGGVEKELTGIGAEIYLGNDNGGLNSVSPASLCDTGSTGQSDVNLKFVPKISSFDCGGSGAEDELQLRFDIGGIDSSYGTMAFWTTNTGTYGAQLNPDQAGKVKIFTQLPSSSTLKGKTCTFEVTFQGQQV